MTNEKPHHEHAQDAFIDALFEQSPVNIAALLRACADGELNDEQCARLKQMLADRPESGSQHDFEQRLRDCCSRSMQRPCCPQALRERVGAIVASGGSVAVGADDGFAQRIEDAGSYTRDRRFWSRSPMMGIAAVLLIGVAGVLIWQSASLSLIPGVSPGQMEPASYSERVGNFVISEHNRCSKDDAAQNKLVEHDVDEAFEYFSDRFDCSLSVPDMTRSAHRVEFYGGGDCHLPMTSKSGHLRFDAYDDAGQHIALSLFIAPDPGILPLEEGTTYKMRSSACESAGANLFVWVSGGVQYVLVSEATDETCASVRSIMNAPDRLSEI